MLQEAFCMCESPFCDHKTERGEVIPCMRIANGKIAILKMGDVCTPCATNYMRVFGEPNIILRRMPRNVVQFIESGNLLEEELEQEYLQALSSDKEEEIDE